MASLPTISQSKLSPCLYLLYLRFTNSVFMSRKPISNLYINLACLSVCQGVCLFFVSNKIQIGWTDRAQIICGASRDSREGLWIIKISNICLHQNSIVIKFFKILKIREIFCENPRIIFVLFYDVHKENMFTINLEDGRDIWSSDIWSSDKSSYPVDIWSSYWNIAKIFDHSKLKLG